MIEITPTMAAHVLHHFDGGGIRAGSFTVRLVELITHADPSNRARLALGFPGYVAAVNLAQHSLGGMTELRRIAGQFGATEASMPSAPSTVESCPECRSGKHASCAGWALDQADQQVACPCAEQDHL